MQNLYKGTCLTLLLGLIAHTTFAQLNFRSISGGGDWQNESTWEVASSQQPFLWTPASAGQIPTEQDTVYLEANTTVTLATDAAVADIHFNSTADVIRLSTGNNTLDVHGKIRIYYETAPGITRSSNAGIQGWIDTGTSGKIRFVGTKSRYVVEKGEFGARFENAGMTVEFAFTPGDTAYIDETVRFGNVTVTSGVVRVLDLHTFRPTAGANRTDANDGDLYIAPGATLYGGRGIYRNKSTAIGSLTVAAGGSLVFTYPDAELSAANLQINGALKLLGTSNAQYFPDPSTRLGTSPVDNATRLTVGGGVSKILRANFSVTDTLEFAHNMVQIPTDVFAFSRSNVVLSYALDSAYTTTDWEFPTDGSVRGLVVNNGGDLRLNNQKVVSGNVTMRGGNLVLDSLDLIMTGSGYGWSGGMILQNSTGRLRRPFSSAGTANFPLGTTYDSVAQTPWVAYAPLQVTFTSGTFSGEEITVEAYDQYPKSLPTAVDSLSRYWQVNVPQSLASATYDVAATYTDADISGLHRQLAGYYTTAGQPYTFGGVTDTTQYQLSIQQLSGSGLVTGYSECGVLNNNLTNWALSTFCPSEPLPIVDGSTPNISGRPEYVWEISHNGGAYTTLPNSNTEDLQPAPLSLPGTYTIRRGVTSNTCLAGTITYTTPIAFTITTYQQCAPGQVANYSFDGCDAPTAVNGVNGYVANVVGPTTVTGYVAQGLGFDGIDDYVNLGNDSALAFQDALTIALWVKTSQAGNQALVVNNRSSNRNSYRLELNAGIPQIMLAGMSNPGPFAATTSIADGQWHHVAATLGAGTVRVYVDGVEERVVSGLTGLINANYASNIWLGGRNDAARYFTGSMDALTMYNYAASPSLIGELANVQEAGVSCVTYNALVGYWAMEDTQTTTLLDSVSMITAGTLQYGASYGPGVLGNGLVFDNVDDGADLQDIQWELGTNGAFTWSVWVKPTDIKDRDMILYRAAAARSLELEINRGEPRVWLGGINGATYYTAGTTVTPNIWNHIVVTYANGTVSWTINGQPGTTTSGLTGTPILGAGSTLVGRHSSKSKPLAFGGTIDEIRFYNYALTATAATALYQDMDLGGGGGTTNPPATLVSYYNFENCGSNQVLDSLGTNPGTMVGAVRNAGYRGGGITFDGRADYINLGNSASLAFTSSFSASFWVNTTDAGGRATILTRNKISNDRSYEIANNFGYPAIYLGTGARPNNWLSATAFIADGAWHHVAVIVTPGLVQMYVDGVLSLNDTGWTGTILPNTSATVWIGNSTTNNRDFTGTLDEMRIYSGAITEAQAISLANAAPIAGGCAGREVVQTNETIGQEPIATWSVYPNPSTGKFTLQAPSDIREQAYVQVVNANGKLVYSYLGTMANRQLPVDLGTLPAGMYVVQVSYGQQRHRITVQLQ